MNPVCDRLVYVLVSVFEDRESAQQLLRAIDAVQSDWGRIRVLLIDNGSIAEPIGKEDVRALNLGIDVEILTLSIDLGQQRAIAVGLATLAEREDAQVVVVMDGDGEDRPRDIPALANGVLAGTSEITVAGRGRRDDAMTMKALRWAYRKVFSVMTGETLPYGNFSAIGGRALRRIVLMEELWTHFPATLRRVGYPIDVIDFDRGHRYAGNSKYNLVSLTVHALRSFVPFSETVLARVLWACGIVTALSLGTLFVAATMKGLGYTEPGWLTVVAGAVLTIVLQVGAIALITLLIASTGRPWRNVTPTAIAKTFVADQVVVDAIFPPGASKHSRVVTK
ncbi:MAG: hypothetical protein COW30_01660 [Rhodospirillales bacterium CG15_BIG_FIL_POST_REV_8_21_14_020_66_15]|nr:MAG: hypothetical protein COW30_01660 [Rhodospirillales bacterium CG15_BIG_FIL_POST_REV_8_21_14_020_66_15]